MFMCMRKQSGVVVSRVGLRLTRRRFKSSLCWFFCKRWLLSCPNHWIHVTYTKCVKWDKTKCYKMSNNPLIKFQSWNLAEWRNGSAFGVHFHPLLIILWAVFVSDFSLFYSVRQTCHRFASKITAFHHVPLSFFTYRKWEYRCGLLRRYHQIRSSRKLWELLSERQRKGHRKNMRRD